MIYGNYNLYIENEKSGLRYNLNVGIDAEDNCKTYMPSFSADSLLDNVDPLVFYWDNENYLFYTFYKKVLVPYYEDNEVEDAECLAQFVKDGGQTCDLRTIKEMFDVAIKQKFFDDTIKQKFT